MLIRKLLLEVTLTMKFHNPLPQVLSRKLQITIYKDQLRNLRLSLMLLRLFRGNGIKKWRDQMLRKMVINLNKTWVTVSIFHICINLHSFQRVQYKVGMRKLKQTRYYTSLVMLQKYYKGQSFMTKLKKCTCNMLDLI